jgi:hypothetical protein
MRWVPAEQERIFQNSVSFEKPLAVSRFSCVPQEKLRNVRNFKVAFSKVIRLLKKPQETEIARMRTPSVTAASFARLASGDIVRFLMGQTEHRA